MCFDKLIGATGSHMSLLPEVREITPLTDVKFPRNADFHATTRKLSIVWVEILSGHSDHLLGLGDWNFFCSRQMEGC